METIRRSSPTLPGSPRGPPHALQNFAPSGFSWPHRECRWTRGRTLECARVHDSPRAPRHLRDGRVDALARVADRDGRARARRQRVRCGGRDRLRAAGRRAAPERAGWGGAGGLLVGRSRRAARSVRARRRSRRCHDRAVPRARPRARSRHRRARGLRARARSADGSSCSATVRNLADRRTCSSSRSATPSTAIRSTSGSARRSSSTKS